MWCGPSYIVCGPSARRTASTRSATPGCLRIAPTDAKPALHAERALRLLEEQVERPRRAESARVRVRREPEVHADDDRVHVGALEVVLLQRRDAVEVHDEVVGPGDGLEERRH